MNAFTFISRMWPIFASMPAVPQKWQKVVKCKVEGKEVYSRRYFEMCIFSCIASEFKTGDICTEGSEEYTDYRNQLLTWEDCKPLIEDYCKEMNLPKSKNEFICHLKNMLKEKAHLVDINYPKNSELVITEKDEYHYFMSHYYTTPTYMEITC